MGHQTQITSRPRRFLNYRHIFCAQGIIILGAFISVVTCDLSIVDKMTNQLIFQTASDFVRTSKCGTYFHEVDAFLAVSKPLYTCEDRITSPPLTYLQYIYSTLKTVIIEVVDIVAGVNLKEQLQDPPWVLITGAEESLCSHRTKLINAANAGYAAVILLAPNTLTGQTLNNSLFRDDGRGGHQAFLDVHLVNPWDKQELSKYAQSLGGNDLKKPFGIVSPPRESDEDCKEFYLDANISWLRLQIKEIGWPSWVKVGASFVYAKIKNALFTVVGAILILSPLIFLALYKKGVFRTRHNHNYYDQGWNRANGADNSKYNFDGADYNSKPEYEDDEPPPQPPVRESVEDILRKIHECRARLDISPTSRLTTTIVNQAYKKKALKEHPDKHPEHKKAKQNEIFQNLGNAKEYLLTICEDRFFREE